MKIHGLVKTLVVALLTASIAAGPTFGQENSRPANSTEQAKVFVFVQRTDRHGKYSKSEVFHDAMDDLLAYLKEKNVAIAVDEFGGRNYAESATPMETVFKIARDAKASSLLYVVVDRPLTKWIKMTAKCYDMAGKELWVEEASSGGGLSGEGGLKSTKKRLRERLEKHAGKEGIPVLGPAEAVAHTK